ncbi:MAG: S-layer homology domain-containing protein, partial [Clostridia bacterium]|nr:S-layer homology domain-containing protein [Clostridia bacterium]
MDGVGGGKFDPAGTMTRAMVVTVLYRMEGSPEVEFRPDFTDVKDGKYYSDAVIWAKDNNIVNGVSEGKFDPGGKITREQLATMLYRYADFKGLDVRVNGDLNKFPDRDKVHSYAKNALTWATAKELITGVKAGDVDLLDPRGFATREQFATILMRYKTTDLNYPNELNEPVVQSRYTEKEYPLVTDADIYVAPDGDDSATGDLDHPVATFAHAVEMVRALKSSVTDRSVVVAFKAGTYFTETVNMTAEDSGTKEYPVIYCGYGDGEAIITGGATVKEDEFSSLTGDERAMFNSDLVDRIKKAPLSGKMDSYSTKDILFYEGGVMTLARFPNKYEDGTDALMWSGLTIDDNHIRIKNPLMKRHARSYSERSLETLQFFGYLTTGWYKDILDTGGYTESGDDLDFLIPDPSQGRMGHLRYLELDGFDSEFYNAMVFQNIPEELDVRGEYWVDARTMTLYVFEPSGTYTFPSVNRGVNMKNCDYVTFRGLTMTGYSEHIIKGDECSGFTLDRCSFSACSGVNAVYIDGNHGDLPFDVSVTECDFSVFAGRPISLNGYSWGHNKFDHVSNIFFDNNYVSYTNLIIDDGAAVEVNYCNDVMISHNEFENCSRCAVDYGGCCNMIAEYNTFRRCMYNSQDGGVFYAWNRQYDWGNVVRYNLFYPASSWYGLYIDDAEPGTEVYGNLFYHVGPAVCVHDGRSNNVHDNIMIESYVALSTGTPKGTLSEYHRTGDFSVVENDRYYKNWVSFFNTLNGNPTLKEEYFSRYPELASLSVDPEDVDQTNFVLYPRSYIRDNWYFTKEGPDITFGDEYCVVEGNRVFRMDENPCFVNPAIGDYRIKEGSEFPDYHFEKMGRY